MAISPLNTKKINRRLIFCFNFFSGTKKSKKTRRKLFNPIQNFEDNMPKDKPVAKPTPKKQIDDEEEVVLRVPIPTLFKRPDLLAPTTLGGSTGRRKKLGELVERTPGNKGENDRICQTGKQ